MSNPHAVFSNPSTLRMKEKFTKIWRRDADSFGSYALGLLFIVSVIFVRPQIEGWSISRRFMEAAAESPLAIVQTMLAYAHSQFPRVLEVVPMALGALSANGSPVGWGIAYGIILVGKYFAARWALRKFLAPRQVAVLSILAVVMIPWEGQWRAHNVPMQTATLFMLLAVGTILRCRDGGDRRSAVLTPIWIAMSVASYEALLVIALILPLMAALGPGKARRSAVLARQFPLVIAPILVFSAVTGLMLLNSESRWSGLMTVQERPFDHLMEALKLLYSTALLRSSMALSALALYIFLLCENPDKGDRSKLVVLASALLFLLPLSAAPFMSSYPYLKDGERVGMPIGFGFFMLCTLVCLLSKTELRRGVANFLIACTVLSAMTNAYASWRPYGEMQRPVLDQVKQLVMKEPGRPVLVRDTTNRIGDVFTFQHQDVFRDALHVLHVDRGPVELCLMATPGNRFHADFVNLEFPVSPVPVCQEPAAATMVLDVQWKDRTPVVVRMQ